MAKNRREEKIEKSTHYIATQIFKVLGVVIALFTMVTFLQPDLRTIMAGSETLQDIRMFVGIMSMVVIPISLFYFKYQVETEAAWETLDALDGHVKELIGINGLTAKIVDPHLLEDFSSVFMGAKAIRAYNPPLTLLVNDKNSKYRDLIYNILQSSCEEYKIIAGNKTLANLSKLLDKWLNEKLVKTKRFASTKETKSRFLGTINKIRVEHFDHEFDLHTEIGNLGKLGEDLRGMSFFLIETYTKNNIVLLYLFGEPFASRFEVTSHAIKVVSKIDTPGNELYKKLSDTYDRRWKNLATAEEEKYSPQTLSELSSETI